MSEIHFSVRSLDANISLEEYNSLPKNPLYIILDNLRSAFNVGAIFRLCDAMRVAGLFLCGYTAYPPHVKLQKTARNTDAFVPWRHFDKTIDAVLFLKEKKIPVWAAETTSNSKIFSHIAFPIPIGIVFGNEALGISKDVLLLCDECVEIPLFGFKNSLNVATACSVIGYKFIELLEKSTNK